MPNNIKAEDVNRMFPFDFYNELSEHLKEFTLLNPAFILKDQADCTMDQRKSLFETSRQNTPMAILNQHNLIDTEPFGELLTLEVCCHTKDKDTVLTQQKKRSQLPLSIIVVQLYDSTGSPVFATDVTKETIEQIPEVLWDDPNLLIAIVSFTQEGSDIAVIKIPKQVEKRLFESVPKSDG